VLIVAPAVPGLRRTQDKLARGQAGIQASKAARTPRADSPLQAANCLEHPGITLNDTIPIPMTMTRVKCSREVDPVGI
jgi:hypothetical protein